MSKCECCGGYMTDEDGSPCCVCGAEICSGCTTDEGMCWTCWEDAGDMMEVPTDEL